MTVIIHNTGSALLDELKTRHDEIMRQFMTPRPKQKTEPVRKFVYMTTPYIPPYRRQSRALPQLPAQNIKSIEERLAEVDTLPKDISVKLLTSIRKAILESAKDCGEYSLERTLYPEKIGKEMPIIAEIQKVVADHFGVSVNDIISVRRGIAIILPRKIAMYLAKQLTLCGGRVIGRYFGNRDASTIRHSVREITRLINTDKGLAEKIATLRGMLES